MIEYLLDTKMVSAMVGEPRGRVGRRARQFPSGSVGLSIISAGEARYGYENSGNRRLREDVCAVLDVLVIVELESPTDEIYGRIRAQLKRAGTPIGANDLWIAAHALALDCTLVTANVREFRRVPGLRVENWLA